jgi:hypothetical protein
MCVITLLVDGLSICADFKRDGVSALPILAAGCLTR